MLEIIWLTLSMTSNSWMDPIATVAWYDAEAAKSLNELISGFWNVNDM
jgi:hypothetical protein